MESGKPFFLGGLFGLFGSFCSTDFFWFLSFLLLKNTTIIANFYAKG